MKIAVSGKGGSGKTTIAALLAVILKERGFKVLAIDCDPDSNLLTLFDAKAELQSISGLKEMIKERTAADGGLFKLNPFVNDLPDKYSLDFDGIRIMQIGKYTNKTGCFCPENSLIKALISHLVLERDEAVVLDMEAGIEHLTRGVVAGVDMLFLIVEPEIKSIETARKIKELAEKLGVRHIEIIANKIWDESDKDYLRGKVGKIDFAGFISYNPNLRKERGKLKDTVQIKKELEKILDSLKSVLKEQSFDGDETRLPPR
ncbi:MAG: ArsA-related P-loop ATPase [Candidatus Omnitrophota bacterium]|nr:AAA family ATPase [Candidatus Omnitrophota bacterium]MBU2528436.1 AAA family ATPase [bacterium]MBU3930775.1 AAA family ATPase [bacterium]MBU4123291.1 AAA family ATPase [bacterium]